MQYIADKDLKWTFRNDSNKENVICNTENTIIDVIKEDYQGG